MMALRTLPAPAAQRFAKIVGMIGSDNDGEVVNAARAATRLLLDNGMTWQDAVTPPIVAARPLPVAPMTSFTRKVLTCRDHPHLFNGKERDFLRDMDNLTARAGQPSDKQGKWLDRLYRKATDHLATVTP